MNNLQTYTVKTDGWVAGKYRKAGDPVSLTARQAQYENVTLETDDGPEVKLTGSLDDPLVKKTGLAAKEKVEAVKRSKSKK